VPQPYETDDVIVALATPPGRSALAIVRISGAGALAIASSVLHSNLSSDRVTLAGKHFLRELDLGAGITCDAVVICFIAPHSFSGEDTVEFSLPGNMPLVDKLITRLREAGARPAEPGEFSFRAYLNGKLDLAQAEAVNDTICASSEEALRLTHADRIGGFSAQVQRWLEQLTTMLARIEAVHDYPGDVEEMSSASLAGEMSILTGELQAYLDFYAAHNKLRGSTRIVIAGPPNVGKSTLFNALLGFERAITAPEPGTTRDYLEEPLALGGMSLALVDTAGLRNAHDLVEMMGVERAEKMLKSADALILVEEVYCFQQQGHPPAPRLAEMSKRANEHSIPCFMVLNKLDTVPDAAERKAIEEACNTLGGAAISAKRREGLELVRSFIISQAMVTDSSMKHLLTERQARLISKANLAMQQAQQACSSGTALDAVSIDLYDAHRALAGILSAENRDLVLDEVFRRFCLGK
jgi:tRNA modification GTPase